MNNNVRKLTDGAMMLAIIGALLLINRQTAGLLESSFLFLLPLPMVFYSAKYGMKSSLPVIASTMLLCVILGTPQTIFYVGAEACIGTYYGNGINKQIESSKLLITTMVFSALISVLTMIVFASFFGYDLASELSMYEEMFNSMSSESGLDLSSSINITSYLKEIMIISTILTGLLDGLVIHLLSRLLLKRFHYRIPKSKSIEEYYPHKLTGYITLLGMLAYVYTISSPLENENLQMAIQGIGMGCLFYLFIFGVIGIYTFVHVKLTTIGKWIIFVIGLISLSLNVFVAIWGFLYITTDIHQRLMEDTSHA